MKNFMKASFHLVRPRFVDFSFISMFTFIAPLAFIGHYHFNDMSRLWNALVQKYAHELPYSLNFFSDSFTQSSTSGSPQFSLGLVDQDLVQDEGLDAAIHHSNYVELRPSFPQELHQLLDLSGGFSWSSPIFAFASKVQQFQLQSYFSQKSHFQLRSEFINFFPVSMRKRVQPYIAPVLHLAQKHQVDPFLLFSIIWTESYFRWNARSHVGARGLMQIMPATKSYLVNILQSSGLYHGLATHQDDLIRKFMSLSQSNYSEKEWREKLLNLELGTLYIKRLYETFHSFKFAVVAYNMGPGWTIYRLRMELPVGVKNNYLDKVRRAYKYLMSSFTISQKIVVLR